MKRGLSFLFILFAVTLSIAEAEAFTRQPAAAENGMVVSSQHLASQVGVDILKAGGNAIDAAVAVGYAMAVVNPCCGNLGGGGFATIRLADGRTSFVNFREKAPLAATPNMYLDAKGELIADASLVGYLAVAVPGSVLGLDTMLTKFGTMDRATVMAPAIRLAEEGFTLTAGDAAILATATKAFAEQPNVAAIFLKGGQPLREGDRLVQNDLARTLKTIAETGPDEFYRGSIAARIVAASQANGGILSKDDFGSYTVSETVPVECTYRGYTIHSAPPPSSGGTTLCLILNIVEAYPLRDWGYHSAQAVHALAEAMRHAFVDRNFLLGDPDFINNPLGKLLSKDYAAKLRAAIKPEMAAPSVELQQGKAPHEGDQTTHYSIVDTAGNAVAVTTTLNALFGAKVIAGDTGFFLNDEMDDFTTKPGAANLFGLVQGENNAIAPGKRPLSSMSPTIVTKDGKIFMVVGSPGGSRIITIVAQVIIDVIDYGMTIQEAVNAPRIHHQWMPDQITIEPFALSADTMALLAARGHKIVTQSPWGAAEAILIGLPADAAAGNASSGNDAARLGATIPGMRYGGHDDRRPAGSAAGH
ncbi:MAG: gamma-glutamyltransferase [Rhizobiales bacterium]|nr:gamma-glutamyltransferase [Hyphomicrobiales bacterium]